MSNKHQKRFETDNGAQTEQALRAAESSERRPFDRAEDGILILDVDTGRISDVNPSLIELLGLSRGEMVGKTVGELRPFKDIVSNQASLERLLGDGHVRYHAVPLATGDGRKIAVEFVSDVYQAGDKQLIQCSLRDITERKQAEAALRQSHEEFKDLFDNAPVGFYEIDAEGRVVRVNQTGLKMLGYSAEELVGQFVWKISANEELSRRALLAKLKGEKPSSQGFERVFRRKDGSTFPVFIKDRLLKRADGVVTGICAAIQDITERKRVEEKLRESEERFRTVFEGATEGIYQTTPAGRFLLANPALARMLGYVSPQELVAGVTDIARQVNVEPGLRAEFKRRIEQDGEVRDFEFQVRRKDGQMIWVSENAHAVRDDHGAVLYYEGTIEDITARKQEEKELRMLRFATDQAGDEIYWVNRDAGLNYVNDQACRALGYSREELMRLSVFDIGPLFPKEKWGAHWERCERAGPAPYRIEGCHRRKDGSTYPVELSINPFKAGNVELHMVFARDITDYKRAEAAVRESEQKYRELVENANSIILRWTREGQITFMNEFGQKFFGYSADEILGRHVVGTIVPETESTGRDLRPLMDRIRADPKTFEQNINENMRRNGERVWIAWTNKAVLDKQGQVTEILSIGSDITERKWVEEKLRESEERFRTVFEGATEGIYQTTPAGRFLLANPALARMLGYASPQELVAGVTDIARQVNVEPGLRAEFKRRLEQDGEVRAFEFEVCRKDGQTIWVSENAHAVRDDHGAVLYYEGTIEDITARKQAEELLRHEQVLMTILMDNIPDGVYFKDLTSCFIRANRALARRFGLDDPAQLVGKSDADFFSAEHANQALADEQKIIRTGQPLLNIEEKETWPDGTIGWVLTTKLPLRDATGRIIGTCGISRDITERKRAEAQLERNLRETRLRLQVSQALADAETEDEVLDALIQNAGFYPQAFVVIFTFDRREGEPVAIGRRENTFESGLKAVMPIGGFLPLSRYTLLGRLTADQPFVSENVFTDERIEPAGREILEQTGAASFAMFPLTVGSERMALILAMAKPAGYFDEEKQRLYQTLAERGAVALHAARLRRAIRESQQRFQALVETISDWIWEADQNGFLTYVSPRASDLLGYEPAELLGRKVFDFMPPEETGRVRGIIEQLAVNRQPMINVENTLRHKDGRLVVFETSAAPFFDPGGEFKGYRGVNRDITERKRAEEELRESEAKFRALAEESLTGVYLIQEGRFRYVNAAEARIMGYTPEELLALPSVLETVAEEDRPRVAENFRRRLAGEIETLHYEFTLVRKDGERRLVEVMGSATTFAGRPAVLGTLQDITDRKRAEVALEESRRMLRSVLDTIPVRVFWKDLEGRYLGCNQPFATDAGLNSPKELLGKTDFDMGWKEQAELYRADDQRVITSGEPKVHYEEPQTNPEGKQLWLRTSKVPLRNLDGQIIGVLGTYENITERKQAEEAQARLATAVEQAAESIVITDTRGTILYVNPAFEKASGYTRAEALGQNARLLKSGKHDAEFYRRMWEVLGHGETWSGHLVNRRKDGVFYEEEATISPVRDAAGVIVNYVAVKRDVTRERQLEAQFRQAQKMEAIGQLAGGVAHDFNNILGVIIGYSDLITLDLDPDSPLRKYVEEIREASGRAAGLTRQLLVFSRKQKVEPVVLDLNDAVKDLDKMLRRLIGENIEMTVAPGEDLGHVLADPGHLGQVLMNLAVNARDAMPNGGRLTIATRNVMLDETRARAGCGVVPGAYVMLSVSDTGIGMTPEVKARLFEALFTTKPAGKGTGLGLATCQTIVQQAGGHIEVESEAGRGATFRIYFPRVDKPVETAGRPAQTGPLPRGKETVLLVEDEPSVRHLAASVLEAQGYTVLRANNGQEALRLVRDHKGLPIRLVVTDVIMPRMGGRVMADWLKTTYPDLKVLFTSGYTDDAIAQQGGLEPGVAFLAKPYSPETLARNVRAILDDQADTALFRKQGVTPNPSSPGSP